VRPPTVTGNIAVSPIAATAITGRTWTEGTLFYSFAGRGQGLSACGGLRWGHCG
jgi:hypothetical protein